MELSRKEEEVPQESQDVSSGLSATFREDLAKSGVVGMRDDQHSLKHTEITVSTALKGGNFGSPWTVEINSMGHLIVEGSNVSDKDLLN